MGLQAGDCVFILLFKHWKGNILRIIFRLFILCGLAFAMSYTAQQADGIAHAASAKKKQASSTSLAGKKGKVRRRLPFGLHACGKAVDRYIAAKGHSAYASTPLRALNGSNGVICSVALNRRSTAEAEALAVRGCQSGTKKWTHAYGGKCTVHASK